MEFLRVPAIEVEQSPGRKLYTFAIDGRLVHRFATISRVKRTDGQLGGYQRPEVVSHIEEIRNYIESDSPLIPNAVVLAFDSRVKFEPAKVGTTTEYSRAGTLVIPVDDSLSDEEKPGFIVDGQQRLAAVRDANVERFPLCVSAFVADDVRVQTEQFILVNATKPLPKGLLYELLPTTGALLPTALHRRRFPAFLLNRLNSDEGSPFKGLIQTPTNPTGTVKDNSILKMLENSLSDGVLYRFRSPADGEHDVESMLKVLFNYWSAVAAVFPSAWNQLPKRSRLMHGAGIVGMGFVMDAIADRYRTHKVLDQKHFERDLRPLVPVCRWTDGFWEFGLDQKWKWNELQNTSHDIDILTNFLLSKYKKLVWAKSSGQPGRQQLLGA